MGKLRTVHRCQQCAFASSKWLGQCPDCEAWNTFVEEVVETSSHGAKTGKAGMTEFSSEIVSLADMEKPVSEVRHPTGIGELDRVLGGGLVPGQIVLLAGSPGIGKSTLMLQAAARLSREASPGRGGLKVLYVTGEESLSQVSGRARRLAIVSENIRLVSETNLARVLSAMNEVRPDVLVLDSIQTIYHPELSGSPGSVGQVRECAAEILRAAKSRDTVAFLLGHVTKEGALAGPKILEHIVDTVLYFDAERHQLLRILRVFKNRFGPSSEMGIFEMEEAGLREVPDASAFFVADPAAAELPGRAVSVALEGTRPILVEIQALAAPTRYPIPRRMATGLDPNRTQVLIAALEKHLRLRLENRDVFVSLAGGLRQRDPVLDLAACMALVSSTRDLPLPADCVFLGEVGLLGQVGRSALLAPRLKEAQRLGFKRACVPQRSLKDLNFNGTIAVEGFETVEACVRRWHLAGSGRGSSPGGSGAAPRGADALTEFEELEQTERAS